MIKIADKCYAIDITRLMQIVTKTPQNEKNILTSLTQVYPLSTTDDNDEEEIDINGIASKEIIETKSTLNETMNNIRYDFLKMILTPLLNIEGTVSDLRELTFSQKLSFNTLINEGIIIEK